MRKAIGLVSTLFMLVCLFSASIAVQAKADPIVWDFSSSDDGFAKATGQDSYLLQWDQENHRMFIFGTAGWGTFGIGKSLSQPINPKQYSAIKFTMASSLAAPFDAYLTFDGATAEDPNGWVNFTVPVSGDYIDITVDLSDNEKWNSLDSLDYFAFRFGATGHGTYIYFDKVELIPAPGPDEDEYTENDMVMDFETDLEGFTSSGSPAASSIEYNAGEKAAQGNMLAGWGSIIFQKMFDTTFNGGRYNTAKLSIKNPTAKDITVRLTFATVENRDLVNTPSTFIDFLVPANPNYVDYYLQICENEAWNTAVDIDTIWVQTCIAEGDMTPGQAIYLGEVVLFQQKTAEQYAVRVDEGVQATVQTDKPYVNAYRNVNVSITPEAGKQLKAGGLTYSYEIDGTTYTKPIFKSNDGTNYTFTMPKAAVTINAQYVDKATAMGNIATLGAQARNAAPGVAQGLRFITRLYIDGVDFGTMTAVMNGQTYTIKEFGTLILPADMLGGNPLTLDTQYVAKAVCTRLFDRVGSYVDYAAVLINIPETDYDREFTARAYLTVEDALGTAQTLYYDSVSKSVNGVGGFKS